MNKVISEAVRMLIGTLIGKYLSQYTRGEYEKRAEVLYSFSEWLYFEINKGE